jgi:hypothetical protein
MVRAPWYDGMWQRLIGAKKTAIKEILGKASINLQTLQTINADQLPTFHLTTSNLLHGRRLTALQYCGSQRYDRLAKQQ